jgi:hypothetical protein
MVAKSNNAEAHLWKMLSEDEVEAKNCPFPLPNQSLCPEPEVWTNPSNWPS